MHMIATFSHPKYWVKECKKPKKTNKKQLKIK